MDFKQFKKNFTKTLEESLETVISKANLKPKAEALALDIRKRTKLGKGVVKNKGSPKKLKPLAPSTKKTRGYAKKLGKLDSSTSKGRSNLTHTGKMLDSIKGTPKEGKIKIEVTGERSDIAEYVSKDRPFLEIDKGQFKELQKTLENELVTEIKKKIRSI